MVLLLKEHTLTLQDYNEILVDILLLLVIPQQIPYVLFYNLEGKNYCNPLTQNIQKLCNTDNSFPDGLGL